MEDDADLWAAALRGDGAAFGVLFDRHHGRVFRHVVGLLDGPVDADDLTSAAFLELWRRRDAVRVVEGSVLPWLLVTAGYLSRNHRRRLGTYRSLLQRLPRQDPQRDAADEAEQRADADRSMARLRSAMGRLRPVDVELVALVMVEGLPVGQAGAALGLTAGAARVRLHRARRKLREWAAEPAAPPQREELS